MYLAEKADWEVGKKSGLKAPEIRRLQKLQIG
jgi:hypothetical protein